MASYNDVMYLYEHHDWTQFTWNDDVILPLLGNTRFAQGKLLGRIQDLGFSLESELELSAVCKEVIASSRIEGVSLDAEKVRSSVARNLGLDTYDPDLDTHSVDGAVAVLVDATSHCRELLTFERLAGWHNSLFPTGFSGLHRITVADWRTAAMSVVSGPVGHEKVHYEAPDASKVPELMDEFLSWANESKTDPLLKAGIAHLWFLTIHPFDNGNGRIARAITELFLARSDQSPRRFYSMADYILAHRESYYDALEHTQKGTSDVTSWLEWFLNALGGAIEESDEVIDGVLQRNAWWQAIQGISLNERQRKMLEKLLGDFEGKLTLGKWAKLCKVSSDTALRDINDLIAKGILVRDESASGRSTSYGLVDANHENMMAL